MAFKLPPPPLGTEVDSFVWKDWFNRLQKALTNIFISVSQGGTGLSTLGTSNQILGVNNADTALEYKTLTPGSNITISNTAGVITISSTGGAGSVGPQGATGFGMDGLDGEDGLTVVGPQGPQGIQGIPGTGGSGGGGIGIPGVDGEDGQDSFIYLTPVNIGGGSGLTHPQVLTRVSFRM